MRNNSEAKKSAIVEELKQLADAEAYYDEWHLFAYNYSAGDPLAKQIGQEAFNLFMDKNALDFTVFPSAMHLERRLVSLAQSWMRGTEETNGIFTSGGTESLLLAVLAAREQYRALGKNRTPVIVAPETIHPSLVKAAFYFGMRVHKTPIGADGRALVKPLIDALGEDTALVALSAPSWAYGNIDPVAEIAPEAARLHIPVHVDACFGGMYLPFARLNGLSIADFDFSVTGVSSISLDFHKFGYTPKGASMVLFRDFCYATRSTYVNAQTPGYVLVNRGVLSSKSVGHLAAAYAVVSYIGTEGYRQYAHEIGKAAEAFRNGLSKLGFIPATSSEDIVCTFYHPKIDLVHLALNLKKKGWVFHLLKANPDAGIPACIHLTINPVHLHIVDQFLKDIESAMSEDSGFNGDFLRENPSDLVRKLSDGSIDPILLPVLLDVVPPSEAEVQIRSVVNSWFKP